MTDFKKKFNNIIFKVFIGFLILSFVFFGVSSFILGNSSLWVAKINGNKISYNKLKKSLEIDRELLLKTNPNNERAINYVNSARFQIDVLRKLINQELLSNIGKKYDIKADKRLILESVANDPNFNENGKFNKNYFRYFLAQNGLNEKKYIEIVENEIINAIVVNSLSASSPVDEITARKISDLNKEQRYADIVKISERNLKTIKQPKDSDLKTIYQENQDNFVINETRDVSYLAFNREKLIDKITVSEAELKEYYNKNQENYKIAEKRDFYHIIFKEEKKAQNFLDKIKKSNNKTSEFIELASKSGKSKSQIQINNADKNNILPELSDKVFALKKGEISQVLKSDLGYHIFLTKNIKTANYISYDKIKAEIKKEVLADKSQRLIEEKISNIENFLLSSNSLEETAKNFNLGQIKSVKSIDQNYQNSLTDFSNKAFLLNKNQTSNLYSAQNKFFALKVNEIYPKTIKDFSKVKTELKNIYFKQQKAIQLKKLAQKISSEIQENPKKAYQIAKKYNLKFIRNKKFNRFNDVKIGDQKVRLADSFHKELFDLKVNNSTSYHKIENNQFQIGILKKINPRKASTREINNYQKELSNIYRGEILNEFNNYLQKEFNIEVNQKFLKSLSQK